MGPFDPRGVATVESISGEFDPRGVATVHAATRFSGGFPREGREGRRTRLQRRCSRGRRSRWTTTLPAKSGQDTRRWPHLNHTDVCRDAGAGEAHGSGRSGEELREPCTPNGSNSLLLAEALEREGRMEWLQ